MTDEAAVLQYQERIAQMKSEIREIFGRWKDQEAKDAACWRAFKGNHDLLWVEQADGQIKWLRYIDMPAPDMDNITSTSVMDHLEAHLLASISR